MSCKLDLPSSASHRQIRCHAGSSIVTQPFHLDLEVNKREERGGRGTVEGQDRMREGVEDRMREGGRERGGEEREEGC